MEREKSRQGIQSIERAFHILEQFDLKHDELSITELSELADLPISTVHRFLSTLEGLGYIRQNEANGRYRLGLKAFILGTRVKTLEEMRSVARTYLKDLFAKYNETTHLVIEQDMSVLCVEKFSALRGLVYTPGIGETHKLYATSVGKCIMAFMYDEHKLESFLNSIELTPLTKYTITDKAKLRQEIRKVKQQGYGLDEQESEIGLLCFGVPVFGSTGQCVGAISVSIPQPRMVYDQDKLIADIKETATQISRALGAPV